MAGPRGVVATNHESRPTDQVGVYAYVPRSGLNLKF